MDPGEQREVRETPAGHISECVFPLRIHCALVNRVFLWLPGGAVLVPQLCSFAVKLPQSLYVSRALQPHLLAAATFPCKLCQQSI